MAVVIMPEYNEIVLFEETNRGRYKLQLIAQLSGPGLAYVRYLIRLSEPKEKGGHSVDYVSTADGLRSVGNLCAALSIIVKDPLIVTEKNIDKIREFLTQSKLQAIADYLEASRKHVKV